MQKIIYSKNVIFLAIIYTSILVLSNITAAKVAEIKGINLTAAIFFFPITYIISDILTEVYGFKASRLVIWGGFLCNIIFVIGGYFVISLPYSSHWHGQEAFELVFNSSLRIIVASTTAYLVGEFVNSILLSKLKIISKGKYFWLRALCSTIFGAALDTVIFMFVAFYGMLSIPIILQMSLVEYLIKLLIEIIILPATYSLANYLKKTDKVDVYDKDIKFNILSLS